jgi:methyl-accepting chemotaxis protein
VEAARAGEQGRGFRGGGHRGAQPGPALGRGRASEIKSSSKVGGRVATGADLVDQAGKTMHEIVDSVARVATLMSEIRRPAANRARHRRDQPCRHADG